MRNGLTLAVALVAAAAPALATVPMTPWGKPSLEGTWDFKTLTPLSRPDRFKDKATMTPEEAAEIEQTVAAQRAESAAKEGEVREGLDGQRDLDVGYNSGFLELGSKVDSSLRTSLIVDPPDGRMPQMLPAARERNRVYVEMQGRAPAGPEERALTDRCLIGFNANPYRSGAYNNVMQIVQSEGTVAMVVEMVNDHRVIATNGGTPPPADQRFWKGYSVGQWEGDTFVVTTTNYREFAAPYGTGPNARMTERFKRLDEDTLQYEYTIDDPETFPAPFTARQNFRKSDGDLYEYACHEGNYSMPLVLRAARKAELTGKEDKTFLPSWHK